MVQKNLTAPFDAHNIYPQRAYVLAQNDSGGSAFGS